MNKILISLRDLKIGGIEKSAVTLIKFLRENGYDITLVLEEKKGELLQEIEKNQTRFIVVSKNKIIKENATKTSIIFETKNKPGALYKILGLFSLTDINLTKIESRPTRTKLGDYMFFVDIEGSIENENIKKVLEFVEEYCLDFRILGSY